MKEQKNSIMFKLKGNWKVLVASSLGLLLVITLCFFPRTKKQKAVQAIVLEKQDSSSLIGFHDFIHKNVPMPLADNPEKFWVILWVVEDSYMTEAYISNDLYNDLEINDRVFVVINNHEIVSLSKGEN